MSAHTNENHKLSDLLDRLRQGTDYQAAGPALDLLFAAEVQRSALGLSYADVARRMGVSRQQVHKLMSGSQNCTIGSVARLALALECELKLTLDPRPPVARPDDGSGDSPSSNDEQSPSVGKRRVGVRAKKVAGANRKAG